MPLSTAPGVLEEICVQNIYIKHSVCTLMFTQKYAHRSSHYVFYNRLINLAVIYFISILQMLEKSISKYYICTFLNVTKSNEHYMNIFH